MRGKQVRRLLAAIIVGLLAMVTLAGCLYL
jgi:hypothetical protein